MLKIYTIEKLVNYSSEQIILFGLLEELKNEPLHCYNFKNISRYEGLIEFCKKNFKYVKNIKECDFVVLPYKFNGIEDNIYNLLLELCIKFNKKLYCFFNDDSDKVFNLHKNVILYRTSFYNSTKLKNELPLIAFSPDYFNNKINKSELSIGYCGHTMHNRKKYLDILEKSNLKTDFILRNGFWAPGIKKELARKEYFKNMENNIFIFCYRGAGNFSYRFYETLMMGRIPILINTDCVIPFFNILKNNNVGLIINENELEKKNLIDEIKKYYNKNINNIENIQKNNRLIWEKYYSPIGFLNQSFIL